MATIGPLSMSNFDISTLEYVRCLQRGQLTGNEALEEGLLSEVLVVLLEVLLGGGAGLHGNELEAVLVNIML